MKFPKAKWEIKPITAYNMQISEEFNKVKSRLPVFDSLFLFAKKSEKSQT